ncbi:PAS/PAC sensor signal transduction histidine kinase [Candidatus Magnetoovum chiemensis]|nr:PAS/PAC sensor signal transduction histidine kinase [Candidatus Magnetoovum chiemensis]
MKDESKKKEDLTKQKQEPTSKIIESDKEYAPEKEQEDDKEVSKPSEKDNLVKTLMSSTDDLLFILDKESRFLDIYQPPNKQELNLKPEIFIGKSFKDVLPFHIVKMLEKALYKAIYNGTVQVFDFPMIISEKEMWFKANVSLRKDKSGEYEGFAVVCSDITHNKKMEKELGKLNAELEQKLKERTAELAFVNKRLRKMLDQQKNIEEDILLKNQLLSNSSEGSVIVKASNSMIVETNSKFDTMFGYKRGEMTGMNFNSIYANQQQIISNEIRESLNEFGSWHGESKCLKEDGSVFLCFATITPFRHSQLGTIWLAMFADLTKRL